MAEDSDEWKEAWEWYQEELDEKEESK